MPLEKVSTLDWDQALGCQHSGVDLLSHQSHRIRQQHLHLLSFLNELVQFIYPSYHADSVLTQLWMWPLILLLKLGWHERWPHLASHSCRHDACWTDFSLVWSPRPESSCLPENHLLDCTARKESPLTGYDGTRQTWPLCCYGRPSICLFWAGQSERLLGQACLSGANSFERSWEFLSPRHAWRCWSHNSFRSCPAHLLTTLRASRRLASCWTSYVASNWSSSPSAHLSLVDARNVPSSRNWNSEASLLRELSYPCFQAWCSHASLNAGSCCSQNYHSAWFFVQFTRYSDLQLTTFRLIYCQ